MVSTVYIDKIIVNVSVLMFFFFLWEAIKEVCLFEGAYICKIIYKPDVTLYVVLKHDGAMFTCLLCLWNHKERKDRFM